MTELIDTGLVSCESVRRRLKWNAKKAVRNGEKDMWVHPEFVTVYSVTEKGMEFIGSIEEGGGEEIIDENNQTNVAVPILPKERELLLS